MTFAPGTYIVRLAQASENVAAFLLEPETPDGYACWNRFDRIGEQTVVIVDDFLDTLGEKLLEKPEVRAEFDKLAESNPQLRSDPEKPLRRHNALHISCVQADEQNRNGLDSTKR